MVKKNARNRKKMCGMEEKNARNRKKNARNGGKKRTKREKTYGKGKKKARNGMQAECDITGIGMKITCIYFAR